MEPILVSLLLAAFNGGLPGIGAAITGLSGAQIVTLIEGAGGIIASELASHLGLRSSGNSLGQLVDGVVKTAVDEETKARVGAWLSANADEAMRLQPGISSES